MYLRGINIYFANFLVTAYISLPEKLRKVIHDILYIAICNVILQKEECIRIVIYFGDFTGNTAFCYPLPTLHRKCGSLSDVLSSSTSSCNCYVLRKRYFWYDALTSSETHWGLCGNSILKIWLYNHLCQPMMVSTHNLQQSPRIVFILWCYGLVHCTCTLRLFVSVHKFGCLSAVFVSHDKNTYRISVITFPFCWKSFMLAWCTWWYIFPLLKPSLHCNVIPCVHVRTCMRSLQFTHHSDAIFASVLKLFEVTTYIKGVGIL